MHLGLALPQFDFSVPGRSPLAFDAVLQYARAAEAAGLDSVWLADHVFWSIEKYGGPPGVHGALDPLVALAGVARATDHVRVGTLVLCTQLRPWAVTAKALAGLDVVAGGRLDIGLGAGWYEPEFEAAGVPFEPAGVRLRQLADAVETYKAVLTGAPGAPPCDPPPVQRPRPPIFVGGRGDRLIDVAVRHADGWNTVWTMTPAQYRARLDVVRRACDRAGRDFDTFDCTIGLYTLVGEDEADLRRRFDRLVVTAPPGVLDGMSLDRYRKGRLVGTVSQVAEQLAGWAELGVSTVVSCLGALPFAVTDVEDVAVLAAVRQGAP